MRHRWTGLGVLSIVSVLVVLFSDGCAASTTTIVLGGDVMLGRGVAERLGGDWPAAFADVEPLLTSADVAFVNLESPLTTSPMVRTGYDLRAAPEAVVALAAAGFNVVSISNNHAWDAGEAGLRETIGVLCGAGIQPAGDELEAELIDSDVGCDGLVVESISLLAFDDSTASLDVDAAAAAVASAAQDADPIIVSIHWGGEFQSEPSPRQRDIAARLAAAGATVVAGHGPHVLQPVEWIGDTLIAYSLGNLLFDQPYPVDCTWGVLLRLELRGRRVVGIEAIPTVTEGGRVCMAPTDWQMPILHRMGLESTPDVR